MDKIKRGIFIILLLFNTGIVFAQTEQEIEATASRFIKRVSKHEVAKLADEVAYPLSRHYPIPDIKSKQEFIKRYSEVFDEKLVKAISRSSAKENWGGVGWRGIMFLQGDVWLDYDGKLIAVNYQSPAEQAMWAKLVEADRKTLHESIRAYKAPVLILETSKYRIRIDEMDSDKYRYASWSIKSSMSARPDIVIEGEMEFDGTGGNHHYTFKNNGYTYVCDIVVMGEDNSPPAYVNIYKGEKEILSQRAKIVKK